MRRDINCVLFARNQKTWTDGLQLFSIGHSVNDVLGALSHSGYGTP